MKVRSIIVSIAAASVLFTACGGGGGGTAVVPEPEKNYGNFKITTKTSHDVLADKITYVTVLTGDDYINTDSGESFYKYKVTDKGTAKLARFDTKNFGVLKYQNSGATDTVKISITDTRNNKTIEQDLVFNVVADTESSPIKILQTGQSSGDAGETRSFAQIGTNASSGVRDSVNTIDWDDDSSDFGNLALGDKSFNDAKRGCTDNNARLPTEEELLTTITYASGRYASPTVDNNMLDEAFKARETYFWASSGRAINYANGQFTTGDKARFRCVTTGGLTVDKHILYTDATDLVHDLSTGLTWTQATVKKKASEASGYCSSLQGSNWKLPTINQLYSIVDKGLIAGSIIGSQQTLLSSTKVTVDSKEYNIYILPTGGRAKYAVNTAAADDVHSIACVR